MLKRLGGPEPLGYPVDELLVIGAEARAWLEVLRKQVAQLSMPPLEPLGGGWRYP